MYGRNSLLSTALGIFWSRYRRYEIQSQLKGLCELDSLRPGRQISSVFTSTLLLNSCLEHIISWTVWTSPPVSGFEYQKTQSTQNEPSRVHTILISLFPQSQHAKKLLIAISHFYNSAWYLNLGAVTSFMTHRRKAAMPVPKVESKMKITNLT